MICSLTSLVWYFLDLFEVDPSPYNTSESVGYFPPQLDDGADDGSLGFTNCEGADGGCIASGPCDDDPPRL
jgi:hypothetical protein